MSAGNANWRLVYWIACCVTDVPIECTDGRAEGVPSLATKRTTQLTMPTTQMRVSYGDGYVQAVAYNR